MDSKLVSGSSKHSRTPPHVVDGSGSSRHSESDSDVAEESKSNTHYSTMHPAVTDSSGSSTHSATHPQDIIDDEGHRPAKAKKLASSSSASSSSSDSSLEDFFQVDTIKFNSRAGPTSPPKPDETVQIARKDDENDVTSNGSTVLTSSSQVSDLTHESELLSVSPIQFPPAVQVMERSGDYDPYRIPAAVFASKPTTPMEWSVASNESLFSIHVGNNSFSRDHFIMLGGDLSKSGELTKSGELIMFSQTPPVKIVEIDRENHDKGKNFEPSAVADVSIRDSHKKNADDESKENIIVPQPVSLLSSSSSKQTDGSGSSTRSFEFPIKKKCAWPFRYCSNCSWTFCSCRWPFRYCSNRSWAFCSCTWPRCSCTCPCRYCSNCSWAFCSCTWPRCYCTWPSCYCCKCSQASCYCWNCSRKGLCCFSSTILPDGMKSDSLTVNSGKHAHQHDQQKRPSSKWTSCNCHSCFSCCPRFSSCCRRPRCSCCSPRCSCCFPRCSCCC